MDTGRVEAICISARKGIIKHEVAEALLEKDFGIRDDAHAGIWHRQVSLLALESIEQVRKILPRLRNGAFAENIITSGIDLKGLQLGNLLVIEGGAALEVTQIGKECHNNSCAIKKSTGTCIMPVEGIFTKVVRGGRISKGLHITISEWPLQAVETMAVTVKGKTTKPENNRELLEKHLLAGSRQGRISCSRATGIARSLGVSTLVVGQVAEGLRLKIAKCRLGCF
jgi:MOSC domain-containing protein YiiM